MNFFVSVYREISAQTDCSPWLAVTVLYSCLFYFYLLSYWFFFDATSSGELKIVIIIGVINFSVTSAVGLGQVVKLLIWTSDVANV